MKKRNSVQAYQREVRRWAKQHKLEIFEHHGKSCKKCGWLNERDLEIHHKEYKIGIDYVEVLCHRCHDEFHKQEFRLKLMGLMLKNAEKSKNKFKVTTMEEYINNLNKEIQRFKDDGIYVVSNARIDGFPKSKWGME